MGEVIHNNPESSLKGVYQDEYFDRKCIVVDPGQSPMRLDKFLVNKLENVTRSKIQKAVYVGAVLVNGREVKPNYKIQPRDIIQVYIPKPHHYDGIIPENIPLDIRYEDEHLMIVHKPEGLVVHPGVGNYSGTLVNALAYYFEQKNDPAAKPIKKGNTFDRPWITHRIDKDTTGLMVVSKTDQAMRGLSKQFFDHTIYRRYYALIWGEPEKEEGTIRGHIGRDPNNRMEMKVFPEGDQGKWAVTHYKVVERMYYVSLVECRLETGRTHQIRVHMKHIGHPLFNDKRYGGNTIRKGTVYAKYKKFVENCFALLPRQALHAKSLGFIHPVTGEEVRFDSELPDDFQLCLERWRAYVSSRRAANRYLR